MDILISRGEISRHQVKMNERPRLQRAEIRTLSNNNSIDNDDEDDDDDEECFIEAEGPDYDDHDSKIDQKDDVRQSQQESRKLSQELVLTHSNSIQSRLELSSNLIDKI